MKFRDLTAKEIDVRIAQIKDNGLVLLLYKDARCDMNILDETVGAEKWQRSHVLINGNLFCNVEIWVDKIGDGWGEWVSKQDVGTESNTEKEKGQASDSFKRACFNWGIGRELYTAPFIWIPKEKCNIKQINSKNVCYDKFEVSSITIENKVITALTITSNGNEVYRYVAKATEEKKITKEQANVLLTVLKDKGFADTDIAKSLLKYGVSNAEDLTEMQYGEILQRINKKGA